MGRRRGVSTGLPNDREGGMPVGARCAGGMDVVDVSFFNNSGVKWGLQVAVAKKQKGFAKEFCYILKVL